MPPHSEQRLKVAYIIGSLDIGGAEQQLVNTINALPETIEPIVFVLRDKLALLDKIKHPHLRVQVVGLRARLDLPRWLALARGLRQAHPAVVHSHMLLSNLAARFFSPFYPAARVINHEHGLGVGKGWAYRAVDRGTQRLADQVLVVSEASRDLRVERIGLDPSRVTVLPNAIDWEAFSAIPPAPADAPASTWGVAARLHKLKRIDLALELLSMARAQGSPNRLVIAGDGAERDYLVRRAAELGVTDAVTFLGAVTDMRAFYSKVDAVLMLSASEDCPMVVIEGLAAGKFIVGSRVGGIPELLRGRDAMLLEDEPPTALPETAKRLAAIPPGYDSSENRLAARRFDTKEYIDTLLRFYSSQ